MPSDQTITILLVEDDPGHARLIERNLRRASIADEIVTLSHGQAAIDFLFQGSVREERRHLPLLIMLDLNLPVVDGYQVLKRLKADERTKHIPVVVLTITDDRREIETCYALGCNVFVTKPVEYRQLTDAIRKLGLFLSMVKIPNGA